MGNEVKAVEEKHLLIAKNPANVLGRYAYDIDAVFDVISSGPSKNIQPGKVFQRLKRLDFKHVWYQKVGNNKSILNHDSKINTVAIPIYFFELFKAARHIRKLR